MKGKGDSCSVSGVKYHHKPEPLPGVLLLLSALTCQAPRLEGLFVALQLKSEKEPGARWD